MPHDSAVHGAPFALRIVQRREGLAAIIYRRQATPVYAGAKGQDRLRRVAALAPLAFSAARPLLEEAANSAPRSSRGPRPDRGLCPGPFLPLDTVWGARVACFALLAAGLRDGARLLRAAAHLRQADLAQVTWWLGLLMQPPPRTRGSRALRALRILTEAVA
jgi:hypothetical protein